MIEHNEFYLYLIRHGQSVFNTTPDRIGQMSDTPLTDKGRRQAQLLGLRFEKHFQEFDHVFSSDYLRAHDTAKIAVEKNNSIIIAPELREYSAGDWNGQNRYEIINKDVQLRMGLMTNGFRPPNGESMHMVERRASQWLEDTILYNPSMIKEATRRKEAKESPMEIACFSHGMTIKCLLHYVMGFDQSFTWKLTLENTSISKLFFCEEGWRLLTINDHAHLL